MPSLIEMLGFLKAEPLEAHCRQILEECLLRIREAGDEHLEYPVLSISVLEKCAT